MAIYQMNIVTRSQWGAADPVRRNPMLIPAKQRRGATIHWNGPPMKLNIFRPWLEQIDAEKRRVRAIQRFHQTTKGWSDISYSWLVGQSGVAYEGRGELWDQFANGDDQVGPNDGSDRQWYTIMWLGGEGEVPTPAAMNTIAQLVQYVRTLGAGARVLPHSDFKVKTCPGPELTAFARQFDGREIHTEDDDDMTPQQATQLEQIWQAVFGGTGGGPIGERVREIHEGIRAVRVDGVECNCAGGGTVDAALIAKAVADELRNRLEQ